MDNLKMHGTRLLMSVSRDFLLKLMVSRALIKDGDGYGAGSLCTGTDCNDNDAAIHATVTYYPDVDGDGYGNADNDSEFCSLTPPVGYVDNSSGFDVDDTDPFYTDILPTCEVKIIPKTLGWLVGDKEKTRFLLVIGRGGLNLVIPRW